MSVTATAAASSQNITSTILQQLLSGSNAQATSGLSPTVLETLLNSASGSQQSAQTTTTQVPAAITQALGNLLSGNDPSSAATDLSQLQSYFQQNPGSLTSLMSSLQAGAGTYSADGTVSSASSLLSALGLNSSGASTDTSSTSSTSSLISQLLAGQSSDPLLASLSGSSASSGISMLG
jgi:hypothetical protein